MYQNTTIVTLGTVHARDKTNSKHAKTSRKPRRVENHFDSKIPLPQPSGADSCTINSTSSDQHLGGTPVVS
jgi:hypothetical protein